MKTRIRQTSLDAYHTIGDIGKKQEEVYKVIKLLGHASDFDIANYLQVPINRITGRRNELVKLGWIKEAEKAISPHTGRRVIYWQVGEKYDKAEEIGGHVKKSRKGYIHVECGGRMKIKIVDTLQLTGLIKVTQILVCQCGYEHDLK